MIVNNAARMNIPICQTLSPTAASHGEVVGASRSVAIVGAKVTAPKMNAASPARNVSAMTRPRTRKERQRVRRQLVTKACPTPALLVPPHGTVETTHKNKQQNKR